MTPTLRGRWQSRLFLLWTIGFVLTFLYAAALFSIQPFIALFFVTLFGLGWDILYDRIQTRFWDHDWPAVVQFWAGILEGIILFIFLFIFSPFGPPPDLFLFWIHYLLVWVSVFFASQSFMRIFFPRWRFSGGKVTA